MDLSKEHLEIRERSRRAKYRAQELHEQLLLAASFAGYHAFSVGYHWELAEDQFKELAANMGYRVEKIEGEKQPPEPVVITDRETYVGTYPWSYVPPVGYEAS